MSCYHGEIMIPSIINEIEVVEVDSIYAVFKIDVRDDNPEKMILLSQCLKRIGEDLEYKALDSRKYQQ